MADPHQPYIAGGYALKQMQFWQFIADKLSASVPVMLLYVLESKGSSPGRQGFRMAVSADGQFKGSIGGGMMEHKFVDMARARLASGDGGAMFQQVHDKSAGKNQSGMICSGEQTIFLHLISKDEGASIQSLIHSWQRLTPSTLQLTPKGLKHTDGIPKQDVVFKKISDDDFVLIEKVGFRNKLYIVGGGHCSLALSKLMHDMDFYISVIDDREGLSTMQDDIYAHEKIHIPSYSKLAGYVESGYHVYVVIMTFGYRTDDEAFRALMKKEYRYLGMLGSKKKVAQMFSAYVAEGFDEQALQKTFSPVGIQIKSETPEEIAISIAAQIISVKNKT